MVQKADGHPKRFQFTVAKIESLPIPTGKPQVYFDAQVPQLALRCHSSGRRTFALIKRARGITYRVTLGRYPELKIEAARQHARDRLNANASWQASGYEGVAPLARPVEGETMTFGEAFEMYVCEVRKTSKRPEQAEHDLRGIYNLNLAQFQNTALEHVTTAVVSRLHDKVSERGKTAANRVVEKIRAIYNFLIANEPPLFAGLNPARFKGRKTRGGVTRNPEKKRKRFLQPEELARLDDALAKEPNRDIADFVKLLLLTAVRKSNLYAMRWDEVSLSLSTWTIPETKNGESLIVNLTREGLDILEARRRAHVGDNPWVFPSRTRSTVGHVTDYTNQWERILKTAAISDCTFHDLRRTAASYMAIAGRSLQSIGEALGHKSTASTQIYARLRPEAVLETRIAGEAKMREMIQEAIKRAKREQRARSRKLTVVPKSA